MASGSSARRAMGSFPVAGCPHDRRLSLAPRTRLPPEPVLVAKSHHLTPYRRRHATLAEVRAPRVPVLPVDRG
jgi:hypothetical protein